jgi:hypothetical protein
LGRWPKLTRVDCDSLQPTAGGCRRSGGGGSLVAGRVGVVVEDTVGIEAGGEGFGFVSGSAANGSFL